MTPERERAWWSSLTDQDQIDNTAGVPPYDVEAVADLIGPPFERGLDLGCGVGRLTNHIAAAHPESTIYGVDIAQPMIDAANRDAAERGLANVRYLTGDGRTIPLGVDGMFDRVWSITMFQHIPYEATLEYIAGVAWHLRPGGKFTFTVAVSDEPSAPFFFPMTRGRLFGLMHLGSWMHVGTPAALGEAEACLAALAGAGEDAR